MVSRVGNYSIITHFHDDDGGEKVKEYSEKNSHSVIAIPEGAGLIIESDNMRVIGGKAITIFEKNGTVMEMEPDRIYNFLMCDTIKMSYIT